ncbi:hypothetical protein [Candidatus Proelusimicrobium excrementi]|uniref:hypothetical protein n=1 Tax=Candidatus Proelusimicrobium excrementi TaxID=3416222 RepID=UPI003CACF569|nr:hypothetical protein [Elusimicrobiaceae bacterium]
MTKKVESKEEKSLCGIVRPISPIPDNMFYSIGHWEEVQRIIEESLTDDFTVSMVSDAEETGVLPVRIIKNLYHSDIVICDISQRNPNVMFELGVRIAFDKPVIIISDDCSHSPFDTAHIEYIPYPRDLNYYKIQDFKTKLKEKAISTFQKYKNEHFSILKEMGNIQPFKFNDSVSKQDQFSEFADMMLMNFHMLRRDISDIQDAVDVMRRKREYSPLFVSISQQQDAKLFIKAISSDESFKKDLKEIGIMAMSQKLQKTHPDLLRMIPVRMIAEMIRKECLC